MSLCSLMKSYRSLDHMLKRPLNFIIQKGDLGISTQLYIKTKDLSSPKCRKVEKDT